MPAAQVRRLVLKLHTSKLPVRPDAGGLSIRLDTLRGRQGEGAASPSPGPNQLPLPQVISLTYIMKGRGVQVLRTAPDGYRLFPFTCIRA
jgi:hypothetical protein